MGKTEAPQPVRFYEGVIDALEKELAHAQKRLAMNIGVERERFIEDVCELLEASYTAPDGLHQSPYHLETTDVEIDVSDYNAIPSRFIDGVFHVNDDYDITFTVMLEAVLYRSDKTGTQILARYSVKEAE